MALAAVDSSAMVAVAASVPETEVDKAEAVAAAVVVIGATTRTEPETGGAEGRTISEAMTLSMASWASSGITWAQRVPTAGRTSSVETDRVSLEVT